MDTQEPEFPDKPVTSKPNVIELEKVTIKSLADAERLVAGIQQAARRAFGHRELAMGTPSMRAADLTFALLKVDRQHRLAVTMPGTMEVYDGNELMGFVEVREGGGYVGI